jgi:hypothetical protein
MVCELSNAQRSFPSNVISGVSWLEISSVWALVGWAYGRPAAHMVEMARGIGSHIYLQVISLGFVKINIPLDNISYLKLSKVDDKSYIQEIKAINHLLIFKFLLSSYDLNPSKQSQRCTTIFWRCLPRCVPRYMAHSKEKETVANS